MIDGLEAITFDFGNTLVPFPPGPMATVVEVIAMKMSELTGRPVVEVVRVWGEERLRQFAEDVPEGREADMVCAWSACSPVCGAANLSVALCAGMTSASRHSPARERSR